MPRSNQGNRKPGHVLDSSEEGRKMSEDQKSQVKTVIFVPQTKHSELARRLREGR